MEEKTQSQAFLGTEPVGKLLFRLALPAIAAQLINVLYNIVDRVYLGHIPGVGGLALTGVGVCSPIILIISAFAALVSMGGAPLASIELGKQNQDGAKRIMGSCFALQVVLSLVLIALGVIILVNPMESASVPFFLMGLGCVCYGVTDLLRVARRMMYERQVSHRDEYVDYEEVTDDDTMRR